MTTQDLQPGRELDALVAEKVMSYKVSECRKFFSVPPMRGRFRLPPYSSDIAAAWEVVEHLKILDKKRCSYITIQYDSNAWSCGWTYDYDDIRNEETCSTAPHAICLAALKAVEA